MHRGEQIVINILNDLSFCFFHSWTLYLASHFQRLHQRLLRRAYLIPPPPQQHPSLLLPRDLLSSLLPACTMSDPSEGGTLTNTTCPSLQVTWWVCREILTFVSFMCCSCELWAMVIQGTPVLYLADLAQNQEFYKNAEVRPPFTYASLIRQVSENKRNSLLGSRVVHICDAIDRADEKPVGMLKPLL